MNLQARLAKMNADEMEKCQDLLYYYNNYFRNPKDPVLTREEFTKLQEQWALVCRGKMIAKPKYRDVSKYPLTNNEAFKLDGKDGKEE